MRAKGRIARRQKLIGFMGSSAVVTVALQACVIAQPSGDVPRLPESRPTIVHASVVPSTSAVLTRFPEVFIVPVELADPTATFVWKAFVDYNPRRETSLSTNQDTSTFQVANANTVGRTRSLEISFPLLAAPDLALCHVIEVVVAVKFTGSTTGRTPEDPPGGDIVTWFYNPSGEPGGCPALDAGIDASVDRDVGGSQ